MSPAVRVIVGDVPATFPSSTQCWKLYPPFANAWTVVLVNERNDKIPSAGSVDPAKGVGETDMLKLRGFAAEIRPKLKSITDDDTLNIMF
jgi:hypothetical protein